MGKVRYKKASKSFMKMSSPNISESSIGRTSIGMENSIGEFFFINLVELIPFKNQAREIFDEDELMLLSDSIKNYGVLQPLKIVKSKSDDGKFEIVSGERRARAAKIAGLNNVPCIILKTYEEAETAAVIENIHRSDLHPVELAKSYRLLLEHGAFSSANELYSSLGVNRSVGYETLKILELPEDVLKNLIEHDIRNRNTLRLLMKAKNPHDYLNKLIYGDEKKTVSIMRILSKNGEFSVQKKAVEKLNTHEKQKLKALLEDIIKILS